MRVDDKGGCFNGGEKA
ncbi:hypothetical protein D039_3025A, partial [Vibrio parahaemolyticus EKP-028]